MEPRQDEPDAETDKTSETAHIIRRMSTFPDLVVLVVLIVIVLAEGMDVVGTGATAGGSFFRPSSVFS